MRPELQLEPLFETQQTSKLQSLANLEEGDSAFVSCYLDASAGKRECRAFLDRKIAHVRQTLRGIERFGFDSAAEMILRTLDADWRTDTRGMAIFARGLSRDRHLTVVHSATPLENRLVRYRLPELLPLVALQQQAPAFTLLFLDGHRLHLLESRMGSVSHVASLGEGRWARIDAAPGRRERATMAAGSTAPKAVWHLRKALGASTHPLLVAGDVDAITLLAERLPRRAVERLVGAVPIPRGTDLGQALEIARDRLGAVYREASSRLADSLDPSRKGRAATGYRSTLEALRRGDAAALVIADWDRPGLGLPWEAQIQVCHEALRRGIRVVLGDSVRLRENGGVGCLLRHDAASAGLAAQGQAAGLEKVA
jgi:hypothetical protein